MNRMRWERIKLQLLEQKIGLLALIILLLYSLLAIFAFLVPYDPNATDLTKRLLAPNAEHWFGTDENGRDYFARALYGGRISLSVGFLAMLISVTIGTAYGTISGYFGGKIDNIMMRIVDVLMSIPSFFLMLILNAYLKPGVITIVFIIGILSWMSISRIVRAETLSVKEREYVLYSKGSGQSTFKIITKHIIPSIVPTLIVAATISVAGAIMAESALSFIGLGVRPPSATWGSMLNNAQGYMGDAPYLAVIPGLFILTTVLCFNFLGDVFRAAFEPRSTQR